MGEASPVLNSAKTVLVVEDNDLNRLIAQFRVVALLHAGVEGIAIDVGERELIEFRVIEEPRAATIRAAAKLRAGGKFGQAVAAEGRHGKLMASPRWAQSPGLLGFLVRIDTTLAPALAPDPTPSLTPSLTNE